MVEATEAPTEVSRWIATIDAYEKASSNWTSRSKGIVKRYMDGSLNQEQIAARPSRFNILWSNVQTLQPALYAKPPKPNIDRRFQDDDDLGRICSQVLERAVSYYVNTDDFDAMMQQAVLDRLLPGRGVSWIRYIPQFKTERVETDGQVSEDVPTDLAAEDVIADYVHWQDFGHKVARTWQEVPCVWRKVHMDKKAAKKRFPSKFAQLPFGEALTASTDKVPANTVCVYEIWDKLSKRVYWLQRDVPEFLDEKEDPLKLMGFFPCPKPIYATLSNDSLIPSPDYLQYQDQARELDVLTGRIDMLTRALKVAGVYDASAEGVQRLLNEGVDNKLIPVQNWAVLGDKGGLKGVVDFFPMEMIINTVTQLYAARATVKQDLYEVTGISDIVRGATNASETATAQQIKGQFATLRLDHMQKDVARFGRDCVRLMTEVIAEHFDQETIKRISGVKLLTEAEKQEAQQKIQMAQQQHAMATQQAQQTQQQPPEPLPPVNEKITELLELPSWEDVMAVIKDDVARSFRIDIETDSTIKLDQDAERDSRIQFLQAAGGFIQQSIQAPPQLQPLLMEMLMFGVRGNKIGRDMESEFKVQLQKLKKAAEEPQPNPGEAEAQAAQAQQQAEMQLKQQESQATLQLEQAKLQMQGQAEQQKLAQQAQADQVRAQTEAAASQKQAATDLQLAREKMAMEMQLNVAKLAQEKELEMLRIQGNLEVERLRIAHDRMAGQERLAVDALNASEDRAQAGDEE